MHCSVISNVGQWGGDKADGGVIHSDNPFVYCAIKNTFKVNFIYFGRTVLLIHFFNISLAIPQEYTTIVLTKCFKCSVSFD